MAAVRGRTSGVAMGERLSAIVPTREKIVPGSGWTKDSDNHYLLVDLPGFQNDKVKVELDMAAGHLNVTGERQLNEREHVYFEEIFTLPAESDVDKISGKFDSEILHITVPKIVAVVQADKEQPEKTVQETKEPQIVQEKKEPQAMQQATKQPETVENQNILGHAAAAATSAATSAAKNIDRNQAKKIYDTSEAELKKLFKNARIYFSPENIKKWEDENGNIRNAIEVLNKNKGIIITAVVAFSLGVIVSRKFET